MGLNVVVVTSVGGCSRFAGRFADKPMLFSPRKSKIKLNCAVGVVHASTVAAIAGSFWACELNFADP